MTSKTLKNAYPVQVLDLPKTATQHETVDAIIDYFKALIEKHPVTIFLGVFDHYAHTKSIPEHAIHAPILGAKIITFCFGKDLPASEIAAVRPRSIAVVEEADRFVISFLDAPNPQAHETMTQWVQNLRK